MRIISPCFFTTQYFCKVKTSGVMKWNVGHFVSLADASSHASRSLIFPLSNQCIIGLVLHQKDRYFSENVISERTFSSQARRKQPAYHYEVLGLGANATQGQIKAAYYKMSKLYHPDVSAEPESHKRFTEISQAYEVLGDVKKRRMYDIGLGRPVNPATTTGEAGNPSDFESNDTQNSNGPSRTFRDANKFDEFYKQHYNEIRKRRKREQSQYMYDQSISQGRASRESGLEGSLRFVSVSLIIAVIITYILR